MAGVFALGPDGRRPSVPGALVGVRSRAQADRYRVVVLDVGSALRHPDTPVFGEPLLREDEAVCVDRLAERLLLALQRAWRWDQFPSAHVVRACFDTRSTAAGRDPLPPAAQGSASAVVLPDQLRRPELRRIGGDADAQKLLCDAAVRVLRGKYQYGLTYVLPDAFFFPPRPGQDPGSGAHDPRQYAQGGLAHVRALQLLGLDSVYEARRACGSERAYGGVAAASVDALEAGGASRHSAHAAPADIVAAPRVDSAGSAGCYRVRAGRPSGPALLVTADVTRGSAEALRARALASSSGSGGYGSAAGPEDVLVAGTRVVFRAEAAEKAARGRARSATWPTAGMLAEALVLSERPGGGRRLREVVPFPCGFDRLMAARRAVGAATPFAHSNGAVQPFVFLAVFRAAVSDEPERPQPWQHLADRDRARFYAAAFAEERDARGRQTLGAMQDAGARPYDVYQLVTAGQQTRARWGRWHQDVAQLLATRDADRHGIDWLQEQVYAAQRQAQRHSIFLQTWRLLQAQLSLSDEQAAGMPPLPYLAAPDDDAVVGLGVVQDAARKQALWRLALEFDVALRARHCAHSYASWIAGEEQTPAGVPVTEARMDSAFLREALADEIGQGPRGAEV